MIYSYVRLIHLGYEDAYIIVDRMKYIIYTIIFTWLLLLVGSLCVKDTSANWQDDISVHTSQNLDTCRGYYAVHYSKWNRVYTCFDFFPELTEEDKKRIIYHEYAHVLWYELTNTEKYIWFNLHYESYSRDDYMSVYAMKWSYSEDIYRVDWLEDFAETISFVQSNQYECHSEVCQFKVIYAEKLLNKYY